MRRLTFRETFQAAQGSALRLVGPPLGTTHQEALSERVWCELRQGSRMGRGVQDKHILGDGMTARPRRRELACENGDVL